MVNNPLADVLIHCTVQSRTTIKILLNPAEF